MSDHQQLYRTAIDRVEQVAVANLDGRPHVVIAGAWQTSVWLWDPREAGPVERPLLGATDESVARLALAQVDGRLVAVTAGYQHDTVAEIYDQGLDEDEEFLDEEMGGRVRFWDLASGDLLGKPLVGHHVGIWSLATTVVDGQAVAVTGGEDGELIIWDIARRERVRHIKAHGDGISGLATAHVDGRALAVTGSHDGTAQAWDLSSGEHLGEPVAFEREQVRATAVTRVNGRDIFLTGGDLKVVTAWDLATREQVGPSLIGHEDSIQSLAATHLDNRPVAVTGSDDGTVRVWDLTSGNQIGEPLRHDALVQSVAIAEIDGRPVAVAGDRGGSVRVWTLGL